MRPRKVVLLIGNEWDVDSLSFTLWTLGYSVLKQVAPPVVQVDCTVELPTIAQKSFLVRQNGLDVRPVPPGDPAALYEAIRVACCGKRGPKIKEPSAEVRQVRESTLFKTKAALAAQEAL